MIAFHVKSKSAEVIGVPSDQLASGLILNVTLNGLSVMPPLSRLGASVSSGDATKFPCRSTTIAYGRTCSPTLYQYHVAAEHDVIGFTHSGHCSAPRTAEPPWVGPGVALGVPVAPGVVADGVELPPHAAATTPTTAARTATFTRKRNRIPFPPFLQAPTPGRARDSLHTGRPVRNEALYGSNTGFLRTKIEGSETVAINRAAA